MLALPTAVRKIGRGAKRGQIEFETAAHSGGPLILNSFLVDP
jgi:hypothetical protein